MTKITFKDLPDTTTPLNASNLNTMQDNIETAIDSTISNTYGTSQTIGYSQEYINNHNEYSTTEQVVGKWIDGKPLYRKVLTLDALKNNGETKVYYDSTYIIQKYDVYVENPTGGYKFHLPVPGTNYISAFIEENNHYIGVQTVSDRTAFTDNYVIIEYTKTTD